MRLALAFLLMTTAVQAQWQVQTSNTTADLRGIHSLGNGVAWASGSKGTVLRTVDQGAIWQVCAVPAGAEALDFRGVQAFDAQTAIVMSSGKGDLSRLYKTTDGCKSWKLVFANPDAEGFWDGISFPASLQSPFRPTGYVIGDPVGGTFPLFETTDSGDTWHSWLQPPSGVTLCKRSPATARNGEALFAASNSSLLEFFGPNFLFVTGGTSGNRLFYADSTSLLGDGDGPCKTKFPSMELPLASGSSSAGAFSFAVKDRNSYFPFEIMIVGGDYMKSDSTEGASVYLRSRGRNLLAGSLFIMSKPATPVHGYRSAVTYDAAQKAWITVGPNGTDISFDDGRNWRPLRPEPGGQADEDQHWNALSLPFVVGPHGRIGLLREGVMKP